MFEHPFDSHRKIKCKISRRTDIKIFCSLIVLCSNKTNKIDFFIIIMKKNKCGIYFYSYLRN